MSKVSTTNTTASNNSQTKYKRKTINYFTINKQLILNRQFLTNEKQKKMTNKCRHKKKREAAHIPANVSLTNLSQ